MLYEDFLHEGTGLIVQEVSGCVLFGTPTYRMRHTPSLMYHFVSRMGHSTRDKDAFFHAASNTATNIQIRNKRQKKRSNTKDLPCHSDRGVAA